MTAKPKTKASEESRMQKIADSIQSVADKLREQVKSRIQDSSAKARVRTVDLAISMVKLQQSALNRAFKELARLQKHSDSLVKKHIQNAEWMPSEGKEIVKEWSRMLNSGREEFQKTLDSSYGLLKNGLERTRDQKAAGAETKKTVKPAAKKPVAKKAAAAPAAKKPVAKKKTAAPATKKSASAK